MIPERHPEQFLLSQFRSPHANKMRWLSNSDLIISISAASADDLSFFAPKLDVEVRIIHLGSAIHCVEPYPVAALKDKRYWIMVGKRKTYKNGLTLLRALALVRDSIAGRAGMPTLVFVGGGSLSTLEYKYILTNRLADHILHISADDHHLAWLYQHALAVLVPSLAEGFSMPLIEGLLCNTPVIASDIEAHREVGHGYCQYVSPVNAKEWADILSEGANTTMKRPSMMLGTSRFNDRCKYYSTNRMIQQHKQCYQDLL